MPHAALGRVTLSNRAEAAPWSGLGCPTPGYLLAAIATLRGFDLHLRRANGQHAFGELCADARRVHIKWKREAALERLLQALVETVLLVLLVLCLQLLALHDERVIAHLDREFVLLEARCLELERELLVGLEHIRRGIAAERSRPRRASCVCGDRMPRSPGRDSIAQWS